MKPGVDDIKKHPFFDETNWIAVHKHQAGIHFNEIFVLKLYVCVSVWLQRDATEHDVIALHRAWPHAWPRVCVTV